MEFTFEIKGSLPTLNQYINAERSNRYGAASMKKQAQQTIIDCLGDAPKFEKPVEVRFVWVRENMRTDPDNVAFAKKFILDALQVSGVIQNDTWKMCRPYDDGFYYNSSNPRTIVTITDDVRTSFSDMY